MNNQRPSLATFLVRMSFIIIFLSIFSFHNTSAQSCVGNQEVITKSPDLGPGYVPISNNGGTYVYANSFVLTAAGIPFELGTWLLEDNPGVGSVRFEIWGDAAPGPDAGNVLATTGSILPGITTSLAYYSAAVEGGAPVLTAGNTYWFVITAVSEPMFLGSYQVGGHTQNSTYADNGTFWFSNDPMGISFLGPDTPELAFEVTMCESISASVPTLGQWGLINLGLIVMIFGLVIVKQRHLSLS